MPSNDLSTSQLREALQLSEQIDTLQQRLQSLLGGAAAPAPSKAGPATATSTRTRKGMSPATRAKMRAAQQARWAKIKGSPSSEPEPASAPAAKKKRGLTAEGRARLAAAMKARWAARKKGAPAPNAASH
jgi:hypothetical protein